MDIEGYISEKSGKLEERIYDELPSEPECIYGMLREFLSRGGKRIRPVLTLACAEATGGTDEEAMPYALAIEIFHNFCLAGDSRVATNPGEFTRIEDIRPGAKVYSIDLGRGTICKNTVKRLFDNGIRDIYELRTKNRVVRATANHPFLVARKVHPQKVRLTKKGISEVRAAAKSKGVPLYKLGPLLGLPAGSKNYWTDTSYLIGYGHFHKICDFLGLALTEGSHYKDVASNMGVEVPLEWKKLEELRKGDLVIVATGFPDEGKEFAIPAPPSSPHVRARDKVSIPKSMSEDLSQMCGFFLGDGCVSISRKRSILNLSVPPGELREAYAALFGRIFNKEMGREKDNIYSASSRVAWLFDWLGLNRKATEKEIPGWVFRIPRRHKMMFLRGYLDSDGTVNRKGRTVYASSSRKLIEQLKLLLDSLGFVTPHVRKKIVVNRFPNAIKKRSEIYELELSNPRRVMEAIGSEYSLYIGRWKRNSGREYRFIHGRRCPRIGIDRNHFGTNPVLSVKKCGRGRVYDIEVENSHNFIANGLVVHNSLIHDDLEDASPMRRGKPTLHRQFGSPIAINSGDALYTAMWSSLLSKNLPAEKFQGAAKILVSGFSSVVEGQGTELEWYRRGKFDVSEDDYFRMARGKTGSLIGISCRMGAYASGAPEPVQEDLMGFGEKIGLSFQIKDDVLNLTADPSKYKKKIGEDIQEGKRSLITLRMLEVLSGERRKEVMATLAKKEKTDSEISGLISLAVECGAIKYAESVSDRLVEEAKKKLDAIEPQRRETLLALADYMVRREK